MGVFDKFLDIMKLSDEDDYEDDFFDDEVDEYPEKTSKNPFKKEKEEYDDFDMQEKSKPLAKSSNKVTPMRQNAQRRSPGMEVCVIRPTSVDDARTITESLLGGRTVILNLEGLDLKSLRELLILFPVQHLQLMEIFRRYLIISSL